MSAKPRQTQLFGMDEPEPSAAAPVNPVPSDDTPPFEVTADDQKVAELARVREAASAMNTPHSGESSYTNDEPPAPLDPSQPLAGQTVYAIDAMSLIFQVFHAIPEMTSPRGEPVNAVFGFTRDMLFLLEKKKPTYLFVAFDLPGPTFRHELYDDYKGDRPDCPADLIPQFGAIRRMLEAMRIPVIAVPRYEADDVLATLARETAEAGGECFIVSADKDIRQLLSDRVKIYNVRKDQVFDAAALKADWGIEPTQVVDFQSLVGDSVDNVPGVPQIGPKSAKELLDQFGTLDGVFANVDKISAPKKRENLKTHREQAILSRKLVELDKHVPVEIDWQAGRVGGVDVAGALALCQEFGFHRIADQMRSLESARTPVKWEAEYITIDTPEKLSTLLDKLREQREFSFDTETTDVSPTRAELVGCSICWQSGQAYYLPFRAPAGSTVLDAATTLAALQPLLADEQIGKIGQNLKYDIIALRGAGIELNGVGFDTMVASYLLDAGERIHNLDELALRYLSHTTIKISELIGTGKAQKRMDDVPVDLITCYAAEDADVPMRLKPLLAAKLHEAGLDDLYQKVELPLINVLAELEHNGIRVDPVRLGELSEVYGARMATIEREIFDLAGHELNIASPKQLQQVLFTELGLPVLAKTKTGPSTDAEVLEELAPLHPLPAKIIEYRQYAKLKGTYVDALPLLVNPRTGRVHCSFHQAVAATGRLSSSDPNLQNIPIRTETGREIRSAFLPGHEGWSLVAADYSQIELRVLAHYSQDETLCAAFARDDDIHALVASQVYDVPLDAVTKDQRRAAKAVNFGIIYGQSAFGLAKNLSIDQSEAQKFIDAYFARYPGVEKFMNGVLEECAKNGQVTTILGRRRSIRGVRVNAGRQRNLAERTAINTVIQGSAADLIKLAMIAIYRRMKRESWQSKMLLQIHDELMFEAPAEEIERLRAMIVSEMTSVMQLRVPLRVDVKQGRNWAEAE